MSSSIDLSALGLRVASLSAQLQTFRDAGSKDTPELIATEEALHDVLDELRVVVTPPARWWQSLIMTPADSAAIQVAFKARIFEHIPRNSTICLQDLSASAKVSFDNLARVLRLLVLHRILSEPTPGYFAHTPLSLAAKESAASQGAGFLFSMFSRAGAGLSTALTSNKKNYSAWEAAFGQPVYTFFENNPVEREQFGTALATLAAPDMGDLADIYPWGELGTLVDVGGGAGHVATTLIGHNNNINVVNQDLPGVIEDCEAAVGKMQMNDQEKHMYSRITFQAHDFYQDQKPSNADAYLLRQCLHNNSDADCVKILKAVVPGMKPGARLLINETVLEDEPAGLTQKAKRLRQKDIMAMTIGAKERTRGEFGALLKKADERFEIEHVYEGRGDLAVLEARLVEFALAP